MEVTLNLPPKAVRMIQALNVLRGSRGAADIEDHLSKLIMRELKREIAEECGLYASSAPIEIAEKDPKKATPPLKPQSTLAMLEDATEIADGLGDEFDYDSQEEEDDIPNPFAAAQKGAITDHDLDKDMALDNPEREAKVEAPRVKNQAEADEHAEETFQQMVMGEPTDEEELDHRVAKRRYRNPNARRAKVQGFNGENMAELDLGGGLTI